MKKLVIYLVAITMIVSSFGVVSAVPVSATYSPSEGDLIKTADSPAVYYVDGVGERHLFVNSPTFWTWYNGSWADQGVITVSASDFGDLRVGPNMTARPGVKLIKFNNSSRVYAVTPGASLRWITSDAVGEAIYGSDWKNRIVTIQSSFENDYKISDPLNLGSQLPEGSIFRYGYDGDTYIVENGQKRKITNNALQLNGFKDEYVINGVDDDIDLDEGNVLDDYSIEHSPSKITWATSVHDGYIFSFPSNMTISKPFDQTISKPFDHWVRVNWSKYSRNTNLGLNIKVYDNPEGLSAQKIAETKYSAHLRDCNPKSLLINGISAYRCDIGNYDLPNGHHIWISNGFDKYFHIDYGLIPESDGGNYTDNPNIDEKLTPIEQEEVYNSILRTFRFTTDTYDEDKPDYYAKAMFENMSLDPLFVNEELVLRSTVKNIGKGWSRSDKFKVTWYVQNGSKWDKIGEITENGVNPGASIRTSESTWTPTEVRKYLLKFVVDENNQVSESNENNNEIQKWITISEKDPNKPDLYAENIFRNINLNSLYVNEPLPLVSTIKNIGGSSAETFKITWYKAIGWTNGIASDWEKLGETSSDDIVSSGILDAGSSLEDGMLTWTPLEATNCLLKYVIDEDNKIDEGDETNNEKLRWITIREGTSSGMPDLIVDSLYFINNDGSTIKADSNNIFTVTLDQVKEVEEIVLAFKNIGSKAFVADSHSVIRVRTLVGGYNFIHNLGLPKYSSWMVGDIKTLSWKASTARQNFATLFNGPFPMKITIEIDPSDTDYLKVDELNENNNTKTFWGILVSDALTNLKLELAEKKAELVTAEFNLAMAIHERTAIGYGYDVEGKQILVDELKIEIQELEDQIYALIQN